MLHSTMIISIIISTSILDCSRPQLYNLVLSREKEEADNTN